MRADNLTGYFDTREFRSGVKYADRQMRGEDDTLGFAVRYSAAELPEALAKYAKKAEKDGDTYFFVTFKIGKRCKWFDRKGAQTDKPTNEELDGVQWNVHIDYKELNGNPQNHEACGYWANGVLLISSASDMFADVREQTTQNAEDNRQQPQHVQEQAQPRKQEQSQPMVPEEEDVDLPF